VGKSQGWMICTVGVGLSFNFVLFQVADIPNVYKRPTLTNHPHHSHHRLFGMMKRVIVTIDGPAASGKSSVSRGVADALHVPFVSSGLLYRAATYLALEHLLDPSVEKTLLDFLNKHQIVLEARSLEPNHIFFDQEDITTALHTDDVDALVSVIAKHPNIRIWVDERLREVKGSFVVEGRDMGTAVFPQAGHKFYLDAPAEVRAKRRVGEREAELAVIIESLKRRDVLDAEQSKPALDAVHIETGELSLEQVIEAILSRIKGSA
jgi:CMP/dCMP kinase